MKKKRLLLLLLSLAVAVFSVAAVGCKKKNNESESTPVVDYFEYKNYYFDGENGENTLTFDQNAGFSLVLNGETYNGFYSYSGDGVVTIPVGDKVANLTLSNGVITFVLGDNTYYFNKDVDYTVTFDSNGGSSVESATVKNGRTLAKPSDPAKDGESFIGWYKSSDFTGGKFKFDGEQIKEDTTLYARWVEKVEPEYVISFNLCYDAENPSSQTTVGNKLFEVAEPQREGYKFDGWWISSTNDVNKLSYKFVAGTTVFNSDTMLYALWTANGSESFLVSIDSTGVEWSGAKGQVTLSITSPSNVKVLDKEAQGSQSSGRKNFDFASKDAGEYRIEATCSLGTVTRYYVNKALARACGFKVEDGTLTFADVKNAKKYYITVECGSEGHNHTDVELSAASYDFSACKMKVGGIKFTVKAVADGYAESVAYFTYDRTLASVGGLNYDADTATLTWNAVEDATNYHLTVNGVEYDNGNATSFDMRSFSGELIVSVAAEADKYNPSASAVYSFTKTTPATPKNLVLTGKTLTWDSVDNAAYTLEVADKDGKRLSLTSKTAAIENFDKQLTFDLTAGSRFTVKIMSTVNGVDSLWSDVLTFNCLVLDKAPEYKNGTLNWNPVFGADGYEICVNGDENNIISVGESATSAKVSLEKEGDNTFKMRFRYGSDKSEWTDSTVVHAYKVEFAENGGTDVSTMYIAQNDSVALPKTTKKGYSFIGWYDAKENGKKYESKTFDDNADIVLYSYWSAKKYEVKLNYGEIGSGDETSVEVTYDSEFTLPVPSVDSKTAMAFIGWYDAENSGGLQYTEGNGKGKFDWMYSNGATLYARYAEAFEYIDNGDGTYAIRASGNYNSLITELYIPDTYNGQKVREIAEYGFKGCYGLKTVSIPDTIEVIASTAFLDCSNISQYVVRNGSAVNPKFTVGANGELLEHTYMSGDVELAFIPSTITKSEGIYTIPSEVTRLGEYLFKNAKFSKVVIPASVTEVSSYAFQSCSKLTTIEFLKTEKRAEDETQIEVKPLTIATDAIDGCSNLTEIIFPERLQEIEDIAQLLSKFKLLETIRVVGSCDNQVYASVDGMLCNNTAVGPDTVIYCPRNHAFENDTWTVPTGIKNIAEHAFDIQSRYSYDTKNGYNLEKIVFHGSMSDIGEYAFYNISKLEEVVFSGDGAGTHSGLSIGAYAFANCSALKKVTFEETGEMSVDGETYTYNATSTCGVTEIGKYAFGYCSITKILLPSTLDKIGEYAFTDNEELSEIDFSHAKTNLVYGNYAFSYCDGLTSLNLTDNVYIDGFNVVFKGCRSISGVQVSETSPFYYADSQNVLYNKNITTVVYFPDDYQGDYTLPSTVTKIASGVFEDKESLKQIKITKYVTEIGDYAFKGCVNLEKLEFEAGGTDDLTIGDYAFEYCYSLGDVVLPERTKRIGSSAFAMSTDHNDSLKSITLNVGLEVIGDRAFFRTGLKEITIPYTVQKIGNGAFIASLLEEVTFAETPSTDADGEAVTTVPLAFETAKVVKTEEVFVPNTTGLFLSCAHLKRVVLPERLEYIPSETFNGCSSLEYVFIPSTVRNSTVYNSAGTAKNTNVRGIGDKAFYGCFALKTLEFASGGTDALSFGKQVFAGCESLTTLDLPSRIASFNKSLLDVFQRETTSTTTLKYNVVSFGTSYDSDSRVYRSSGITEINVASGGEYDSYDGVLYTQGLKSVVFCPFAREGAVHVSYKAETFEKVAFGGCSKLTGIVFDETPDGETAVEFKLQSISDQTNSSLNYEEVFYGCVSLRELNFPARLTEIGDYALSRCKYIEKGNAIEKITFAEGCKLKVIGKGAFKYSKVNALVLPEIWESGTERGSVGASVFESCHNLGTLTLPKNLTADEFVKMSTNLPVLSDLIVPTGSVNFAKDSDGIVYGLKDGVKTTIAYVPYVLTKETVVIPATVETIADGAFSGRTGFKYLEFENGTAKLKIGAKAFANSTVESVTLPARLNEMGANAFADCSNLRELVFAEGYEYSSIPAYAFSNTAIEGVLTIPSKVSTIGSYAFQGTAITSVVFGRHSDGQDSVLTTLSSYAFYNCASLVSVNTLDYENSTESASAYASASLPSSVATSLSASVFRGCASLEKFVISDNVTAIGAYFFDGCENLATVNIPKTLTSIGNYAFQGCKKLLSVDLTNITSNNSVTIGTNAFYQSGLKDFIGFGKVKTIGANAFAESALEGSVEITTKTTVSSASSAFMGTKITSVSIDAKDIPMNMFKDCSELESVTLGGSVVTIKMGAFNNCAKLEKVVNTSTKLTTIGGGTKLEYGAFAGCEELRSFANAAKTSEIEAGDALPGIYVAGTVFKEVSGYAFYGCSSLKVADLSASAATLAIGNYAFTNCDGITSVKFPTKIKSIGQEAFRNSSSLNEITIPTMTSTLGKLAFADCANLENLVYNGYKSIPEGAFANCPKLNNVTLIQTVISIGKEAFKGCSEITEMVFPSALTTIGASAFDGCSKLASLTFESSALPTIDATSFDNCASLNALSVDGTIFDNGALYTDNGDGTYTLALYVGSATSFTVKDNTSAIAKNAFKGNPNLQEINLKAVKTINDSAFEGCSALGKVTAPQMEYVGASAFKGCVSLSDIVLTKVRMLNAKAFQGCTSLTSVDLVGIKEENLGNYAFDGCSSLRSATVNEMPYIGNYMFQNTALESFSFDGVTYIADYAFRYCENLTTITDFESVEMLEYAAFEGCINLLLENADFSKAELGGNNVFKNCENIKSLKLGSTTVYGYDFSGCVNLESIEFVNGLTELKNYAFENCKKLDIDNMDFSGVTKLENGVFIGCESLTKIPNMPLIEELTMSLFKGCINLTGSLDLRNYEWASNTFAGTGITEVTIFAEQLKSQTLEGMTSLTTANIVGELTYLTSNAFADCSSLSFENIDLTKIVTLSSGAFKNCLGLTEVDMPSLEGMASPKNLFTGCTNITKVSMPLLRIDSTSVSNYADWFKDMTNLTEVNLSKMSYVASGMFDGCVNLEKLYAPEIRNIEANAFRNCAKLTAVGSDAIDGKIGASAFEGCTLLKDIDLSNVTSIGASALKGCTSISEIKLNFFVDLVGANVFEGWTSEQTIDASNVLEGTKPSANWSADMFTGCDAKVIWLKTEA